MSKQSGQIDPNEYVPVPPPGVTRFGHEDERMKRLGNLDQDEFERYVSTLRAEGERELREGKALQALADEMKRRGARPGATIGEVFGASK